MAIKLVTDSGCDLSIELVKENNIDIACLELHLEEQTISDDLGQTLPYDKFYKILREGGNSKTSQVNINAFEEIFEGNIRQGNEIIYIGLSAALSGTFNSAHVAKNNVLEQYPEAKIAIIDSKSASVGEGLLVYLAHKQIEEGKSFEEVVHWIEEHKLKIIHSVMVEDLKFLQRGGRLSSTAATIGSLLQLKPIIAINDEGKLEVKTKVKGRKKSLRYLVSNMEEHITNLEIVFIAHGDCYEEALRIKEMILDTSNVKEVIINSIGTVIGSHVGPDTIVITFVGKKR